MTAVAPASARIQRLALVSAILASTIAAVDSSAVNVALPAIRRALGGGFAAQQWVANAYLLTLGALILLAGSLTDRLGERRVFRVGVAGFGIGSLLCALAPSIGELIDAASWRWIFLINVPLVLGALALSGRRCPTADGPTVSGRRRSTGRASPWPPSGWPGSRSGSSSSRCSADQIPGCGAR